MLHRDYIVCDSGRRSRWGNGDGWSSRAAARYEEAMGVAEVAEGRRGTKASAGVAAARRRAMAIVGSFMFVSCGVDDGIQSIREGV